MEASFVYFSCFNDKDILNFAKAESDVSRTVIHMQCREAGNLLRLLTIGDIGAMYLESKTLALHLLLRGISSRSFSQSQFQALFAMKPF